jgi:hypothetical protein
MDIETFKAGWQKQEAVSYSDEELQSIYQIRENRTISELSTGFTRDLVAALVLSVLFILILQISDLKTSNFWSLFMGILAFQHLIFYQYQRRLIRKYSYYNTNVLQSLEGALKRLKKLLWFYRLWPASLTIVLYAIYINQFDPQWSLWQTLCVGLFLAIIIAAVSNQISAVLVRKHYIKLKRLQKDLSIQLNNNL